MRGYEIASYNKLPWIKTNKFVNKLIIKRRKDCF